MTAAGGVVAPHSESAVARAPLKHVATLCPDFATQSSDAVALVSAFARNVRRRRSNLAIWGRRAALVMSDRNNASMDVRNGPRWYVAMTQARRELLAIEHLQRQGWRTFLPFHLATRRHARKFRTVRAPAFPRYVFVAFDLDRDRWRSVNGTYGVQRLVMGVDWPLPVPDGVVETLMESVDENGNLEFRSGLEVGGRVRLISGPFAETLGILSDLDASGRVEVLLELLGGSVRVKTDMSQILPATV
jgi:transcription antitermination factor NusG